MSLNNLVPFLEEIEISLKLRKNGSGHVSVMILASPKRKSTTPNPPPLFVTGNQGESLEELMLEVGDAYRVSKISEFYQAVKTSAAQKEAAKPVAKKAAVKPEVKLDDKMLPLINKCVKEVKSLSEECVKTWAEIVKLTKENGMNAYSESTKKALKQLQADYKGRSIQASII